MNIPVILTEDRQNIETSENGRIWNEYFLSQIYTGEDSILEKIFEFLISKEINPLIYLPSPEKKEKFFNSDNLRFNNGNNIIVETNGEILKKYKKIRLFKALNKEEYYSGEDSFCFDKFINDTFENLLTDAVLNDSNNNIKHIIDYKQFNVLNKIDDIKKLCGITIAKTNSNTHITVNSENENKEIEFTDKHKFINSLLELSKFNCEIIEKIFSESEENNYKTEYINDIRTLKIIPVKSINGEAFISYNDIENPVVYFEDLNIKPNPSYDVLIKDNLNSDTFETLIKKFVDEEKFITTIKSNLLNCEEIAETDKLIDTFNIIGQIKQINSDDIWYDAAKCIFKEKNTNIVRTLNKAIKEKIESSESEESDVLKLVELGILNFSEHPKEEFDPVLCIDSWNEDIRNAVRKIKDFTNFKSEVLLNCDYCYSEQEWKHYNEEKQLENIDIKTGETINLAKFEPFIQQFKKDILLCIRTTIFNDNEEQYLYYESHRDNKSYISLSLPDYEEESINKCLHKFGKVKECYIADGFIKDLKKLADDKSSKFFKSGLSFSEQEKDLKKISYVIANHNIAPSGDNLSGDEKYSNHDVVNEILQNINDHIDKNNGELIVDVDSDNNITIKYPESGFTLMDFYAVCTKGNSGNDAKQISHETEGHKGTGFKSLYNIFKKVKITSQNVECTLDTQKCFDVNDEEISEMPKEHLLYKSTLKNSSRYPVPEFSKNISSDNYTTLTLFFKDDYQEREKIINIFNPYIEENKLNQKYLFLKQIKKVNFKNKPKEINRDDYILLEYTQPVRELLCEDIDNIPKRWKNDKAEGEITAVITVCLPKNPVNSYYNYKWCCTFTIGGYGNSYGDIFINVPFFELADERNNFHERYAKWNEKIKQTVSKNIPEKILKKFAEENKDIAYKYFSFFEQLSDDSSNIPVYKTNKGNLVSKKELNKYCLPRYMYMLLNAYPDMESELDEFIYYKNVLELKDNYYSPSYTDEKTDNEKNNKYCDILKKALKDFNILDNQCDSDKKDPICSIFREFCKFYDFHCLSSDKIDIKIINLCGTIFECLLKDIDYENIYCFSSNIPPESIQKLENKKYIPVSFYVEKINNFLNSCPQESQTQIELPEFFNTITEKHANDNTFYEKEENNFSKINYRIYVKYCSNSKTSWKWNKSLIEVIPDCFAPEEVYDYFKDELIFWFKKIENFLKLNSSVKKNKIFPIQLIGQKFEFFDKEKIYYYSDSVNESQAEHCPVKIVSKEYLLYENIKNKKKCEDGEYESYFKDLKEFLSNVQTYTGQGTETIETIIKLLSWITTNNIQEIVDAKVISCITECLNSKNDLSIEQKEFFINFIIDTTFESSLKWDDSYSCVEKISTLLSSEKECQENDGFQSYKIKIKFNNKIKFDFIGNNTDICFDNSYIEEYIYYLKELKDSTEMKTQIDFNNKSYNLEEFIREKVKIYSAEESPKNTSVKYLCGYAKTTSGDAEPYIIVCGKKNLRNMLESLVKIDCEKLKPNNAKKFNGMLFTRDLSESNLSDYPYSDNINIPDNENMVRDLCKRYTGNGRWKGYGSDKCPVCNGDLLAFASSLTSKDILIKTTNNVNIAIPMIMCKNCSDAFGYTNKRYFSIKDSENNYRKCSFEEFKEIIEQSPDTTPGLALSFDINIKNDDPELKHIEIKFISYYHRAIILKKIADRQKNK